MNDNETIRWPTNLDRAAIEAGSLQVRNAARGESLAELALSWLDGKGHEAMEKQLQMVALSLKNLK